MLASEATKSSSEEIKQRLGVILYVKDGYLIREYKNGERENIRKLHSIKVIPGTILKINK